MERKEVFEKLWHILLTRFKPCMFKEFSFVQVMKRNRAQSYDIFIELEYNKEYEYTITIEEMNGGGRMSGDIQIVMNEHKWVWEQLDKLGITREELLG